MQKKMLYVAAAAMLLGTTGCIDKAMQQAKDWCGCGSKASAEPAAQSDDKNDDSADAEGERGKGKMNADALKSELETNDTMFLINTLAKKYYDDCHIVGSVNMPLDSIAKDIQGVKTNTKIVLYCANSSCQASHKAAERLEELGYTNVHLYEGGMKEWFDLGYPSDGPAEEEYLKKGK